MHILRGGVVIGVIVLLVGVIGAGAATAGTSPLTNPKHFFWAPGQSPPARPTSCTNDIIYHGGNVGDGAIGVETKPAVYLIYWGPQWATGFTTADTDGKLYSSKTLQTYLNSFFQNVGGSPWAGVQTQYCRNVLAGSTSCVGGGGLHHEPEGPAEGRLDRSDAGAGRHRHARPRPEPRRRPDREPRRCARRRTSGTTRTRRTSS